MFVQVLVERMLANSGQTRAQLAARYDAELVELRADLAERIELYDESPGWEDRLVDIDRCKFDIAKLEAIVAELRR